MKAKLAKMMVLAAAVVTFSGSALAGNAATCQAKKQQIEEQIKYAQTHNNQYRIQGLQKALREVTRNCSDTKLEREYLNKVAKQKREVVQREADLAKARLDGKADKIAKRERKLQEAKAELRQAEAALQRFYAASRG